MEIGIGTATETTIRADIIPKNNKNPQRAIMGVADLLLLQRTARKSILIYMNTFTKYSITLGVISIIFTALPAAGQEKGDKGALSTATLACVQTAVDVRDNAIIAAWDVQYPAIKTALQTRQAALKSAWAQTETKVRREAIKSIWDVYKNTVKSARTTMKTAHKAAWTKFEADRKACSPKATKDDNGSLGMDNQL